ncbi:hypothetical protein Golax_011636, partial [Gossypium laxum]|nr:hypothetical protein [Gossypium laxum]
MVDSIFSYIRELDGLKEKLPEQGGVLVSASVLNNNVSSMFATKALACVQALRFGTELGLASEVVEGDSLSIIKKCQSNEIDKSEIEAYVRDIQHYQRGFQSVCFKRGAYVHRGLVGNGPEMGQRARLGNDTRKVLHREGKNNEEHESKQGKVLFCSGAGTDI